MSAAPQALCCASFGSAQALVVDNSTRADHFYLDRTDQCRYLAEYRPGVYGGDCVTELVADFKCPPSLAARNRTENHRKLRAIRAIAMALRSAVNRNEVESATWVPIPPSSTVDDPDYDDRLQRVLAMAFGGYDLDARLLLRQSSSTNADHRATTRLGFQALYSMIYLDREAMRAKPIRTRVVLFDDILTTGKHYKCCERRVREVLSQIPICGWFVARRALSQRCRRVPAAELL